MTILTDLLDDTERMTREIIAEHEVSSLGPLLHGISESGPSLIIGLNFEDSRAMRESWLVARTLTRARCVFAYALVMQGVSVRDRKRLLVISACDADRALSRTYGIKYRGRQIIDIEREDGAEDEVKGAFLNILRVE